MNLRDMTQSYRPFLLTNAGGLSPFEACSLIYHHADQDNESVEQTSPPCWAPVREGEFGAADSMNRLVAIPEHECPT